MDPSAGAGILLVLFFILGAFAIWLVIGALILRLACEIVRVEVTPPLGRAILIVLVSGLAQIAVGVVIGIAMIVAAGGLENQEKIQEMQGTINLISWPLNMLIAAAVYRSMVPTSFGKAILIWIMQIVIIVAAIFALVFFFGMLLSAA